MVKQVLCMYMSVKSPEMISYCPASESLMRCLTFGLRCVALKHSLKTGHKNVTGKTQKTSIYDKKDMNGDKINRDYVLEI